MQQLQPSGQQPSTPHAKFSAGQAPCRGIKRPRITVFLRESLWFLVGMRSEKALTNNEGRRVNDTSNRPSENRRIVRCCQGGGWLGWVQTWKRRFYRFKYMKKNPWHWHMSSLSSHVSPVIPMQTWKCNMISTLSALLEINPERPELEWRAEEKRK